MNKALISFFIIITLGFFILKIQNENFLNNENNVFNSKFDKIIYINLEHRKDREKQILKEFNKMDIDKSKIYRINAVHEKYNGHIGCAKSHIKALNYAKDNGFKRVLIFEDDFIFTDNKINTQNRIKDFLQKNKNWDVVQLTSVYTTYREDDINNNARLIKSASTSSAYAINSSFYESLIENLNSSLNKMEHEMIEFNKKNNNILKKKTTSNYALDQNWYPLQAKSNWYLFYPHLGKQGGEAGESSIMSKNLEGFTNFF